MTEQILIPSIELTETTSISGRYSLRSAFRRAVEQTDWDEEILKQESWLNACCWAVVAIAFSCILPILIGLLQS